jgi:hypothetical protein
MGNLSRKLGILGTIGLLGINGCKVERYSPRENTKQRAENSIGLNGKIEQVRYVDFSNLDSLSTSVLIDMGPGRDRSILVNNQLVSVHTDRLHTFILYSGKFLPILERGAEVSFTINSNSYSIDTTRGKPVLKFPNGIPAQLKFYTPAETIRAWDAQRATERR